ncbi:MAG: hypothetical protein ABSE73_27865 [Planctomycetota bacterium]
MAAGDLQRGGGVTACQADLDIRGCEFRDIKVLLESKEDFIAERYRAASPNEDQDDSQQDLCGSHG